MKQVLSLLSIILYFSSCTVAQPGMGYTSQDKKAIKYYEESRACFRDISVEGKRDLACAEEMALKALDRDPNFAEAYDMLCNVAIQSNDIEKAIQYKEKVMQFPGFALDADHYYLASMYMNTGKYEKCLRSANRYLQIRNPNPKMFDIAKKYVRDCEFAISAIKSPKPFDPKNLGDSINTDRHEYFPSLTADDQTLLYTRDIYDEKAKLPPMYQGEPHQEEILVAHASDEHWSNGVSISPNINTNYNEGAPTFSADGKYVIFVGCEMGSKGEYDYGRDRQGLGSCDLFFSEKVGSRWSKPVNMGAAINSRHWESQPCFSSDGKTLYFIRGIVRDRQRRDPGEQDIYSIALQEDGTWSKPKKLGPNVNTSGREESVQIHPDGQTLYFSSNGHTGMGGLDIYVSRLQADGSWGKAENLGYPINTYNNENSVLVSRKGELAYFASDRKGGKGGLDLYSFVLPKEYRPFETTYIKGVVFDKNTKKPLAANFQLIDLSSKNVIKQALANRGNGEFMVAVPKNKDFALIAEHDGYLYYSENYSLDKLKKTDEAFLIEVPMTPIVSIKDFALENVFFDKSKYDLKTQSIVELERLHKFLTENNSIKIELGGHTDSDGDEESNQVLSENRVLAVYNWLVEKGISKERLTYKGYGESEPIEPNDTPENKAKNRRTMVKILE